MKTETFYDKTKWPERGPWDNEPDKVVWIDPETDLDCMIVRNQLGNLCGYVGVPPGHPLHGVGYNGCPQKCPESYCEHSPERLVSVHGGLTFSHFCHEGGTICHVPEPGRPDHVYWFGFDCAHSWDKVPATTQARYDIDRMYPRAHEDAVYRDVDYVKSEVTQLAKQLASMKKEK